jgi:hypothetical protein
MMIGGLGALNAFLTYDIFNIRVDEGIISS